jgi:MAC/Perforin domain
MKFLSYFGTHAVTDMMMGGRLGMRSTFTSNSWSQMESSQIDILLFVFNIISIIVFIFDINKDKGASAGFSLFSFSAAASGMTESEKKQASNYQRFVTVC